MSKIETQKTCEIEAKLRKLHSFHIFLLALAWVAGLSVGAAIATIRNEFLILVISFLTSVSATIADVKVLQFKSILSTYGVVTSVSEGCVTYAFKKMTGKLVTAKEESERVKDMLQKHKFKNNEVIYVEYNKNGSDSVFSTLTAAVIEVVSNFFMACSLSGITVYLINLIL